MRAVLVACLSALALAACGGDDDSVGDANPSEIGGFNPDASIAEVAAGRVEEGHDVRLAGRAYPIGEAGFVLAGQDGAIFVDVLPSTAEKIDPGERIGVAGQVAHQGGAVAAQLDAQLGAEETKSQAPVVRRALKLAPIGRGKPFISDASVSGEDAEPPATPASEG